MYPIPSYVLTRKPAEVGEDNTQFTAGLIRGGVLKLIKFRALKSWRKIFIFLL